MLGGASLVYGVLLNVHDLVKAGKAYGRFIPNAFVLDLIIARKERGGVVTYEGSSTARSRIGLADVPVEVLEMIRWELLRAYVSEEKSYFDEAHESFIEEYIDFAVRTGVLRWACECHMTVDMRRAFDVKMERILDPSRWGGRQWDYHDACRCNVCEEMKGGEVWGSDDEDDGEVASAHSKLRRLLSAYGLSLPTLDFVNEPGRTIEAYDLAWVVCLPTFNRFDHYSQPISSIDTVHHSAAIAPNTHSATSFPPSHFITTPSDDAKFHKLVRDFDVRVMDVGEGRGTRNTSAEVEELKDAFEKRKKLREGKKGARFGHAVMKTGRRHDTDEEKEEDERDEDEDDEVLSIEPEVRPRWLLLHSTLSDGL